MFITVLASIQMFERRPSDYLKTNPLGEVLAQQIEESLLHVIYLRPVNLSAAELTTHLLFVQLLNGRGMTERFFYRPRMIRMLSHHTPIRRI